MPLRNDRGKPAHNWNKLCAVVLIAVVRPIVGGRTWHPSAEVNITDVWGRDGEKGVTPKPDEPGQLDKTNIYLSADRKGFFYVLLLTPDGMVRTESPPNVADSKGCTPTQYPFKPNRKLHFATYQHDAPPGQYCLFAILANEPMEGICDRMVRDLRESTGSPGFKQRMRNAIQHFPDRMKIAGFAIFPYEIFGPKERRPS